MPGRRTMTPLSSPVINLDRIIDAGRGVNEKRLRQTKSLAYSQQRQLAIAFFHAGSVCFIIGILKRI